ncbi:uncharacterized protein LOC143586277 [Bidens hawaiensis]|uniref:uncharacterized protein LOC143586277 n=1 Tax=Bidens hawaiensis TaxID=980011 RepID=UPI00404AFDB4
MAIREDRVDTQVFFLNEKDIKPSNYRLTDESMWYLDNGASNHMTGSREHFTKLDLKISGNLGTKLKLFRTDRGGEFTSKDFSKFCKENGIVRQLTAPYSPQQNGMVERRNRTILYATRSMLNASNMRQIFWAEAVRHAVNILNRTPNRTLVNSTPFEALKGDKMNLKHLKVFGCKAYAKVLLPHLRKLDDRSNEMVYLGSESGSKAYRLFDPRTNRFCISRDVHFKEKEFWNWKEDARGNNPEENEWTEFIVEDGSTMIPPDNPEPQFEHIEVNNHDEDEEEPHSPAYPPNLPVTPQSYTHEPNSETSASSSKPYDHTPLGFHSLEDIYARATEVVLYENELLLVEEETRTYKEATVDEKWIETMKFELDSINRNQTWILADLPKDNKPIGLKWCSLEQAVYIKASSNSNLIVGVYVDDLIISRSPKKEIDKFKSQMEGKFEISDLGLLAYYLGIEVTQTGGDISIKQIGYVNKILKDSEMLESNDTKIPMDPGLRLTKVEGGEPVDPTK